jgi:hypothetical protein
VDRGFARRRGEDKFDRNLVVTLAKSGGTELDYFTAESFGWKFPAINFGPGFCYRNPANFKISALHSHNLVFCG